MSTSIQFGDIPPIQCTEEQHAPQILEILNEAIVNSTAVYDYKPRPASSMGPWFRAKVASNFPVLGVEGEDGQLLGFATYGGFRAWPAYKYTVEHSVYVRHDVRGRGIGNVLLSNLIKVASERDVHVLVAGIEASNRASIQLHERLGFQHVGTVRECGFKFDRWLDLSFYQRMLSTPAHPVGDE